MPKVQKEKSKNTRSKSWFFTWNNYPDTHDTQLLDWFKDALKYAFQEETGEQGTKHIQGVVHFKNARFFEGMKKLHEGIHWETCKDLKAAIAYCTKMETRTGRVWTKGVPKPLEDPMEGLEYKPWQKDIIEKLKGKPDKRKVHWRWEGTGGSGKSTFAKHILMKYNALYISGGKATDVKAALAAHLEQHGEIDVVMWDIPRSVVEYISYQAIEEVKNGAAFSGKYESKSIIFNPPHVFIFANVRPDMTALSEDRWDIVEIQ